MTLTIREHTSKSYSPRTYANAHKGDVTIAIAVDYTTAGEKLTHKAAGEKYLKLDPFCIAESHKSNARKLWSRLNLLRKESPIINVAGNGIYTLVKHGICQEEINQYVYEILKLVNHHWPIGEIISGGQTGVDLAGGVAGLALGIPTTMLLPNGFVQRDSDGVDREYSEEEIRKQVEYYEGMLWK